MMVNGQWVEAQFEQAKKEIKRASKQEIEQVALKLFENYIRKL
jgi:TPR repeat protein